MVKEGLPLIWAQVGIGCRTFLINFFWILERKLQISTIETLSQPSCYFRRCTSIDIRIQ